MNKITFFKNNKEIEIVPEEINYSLEYLTIKKDNNETSILLDFKNNRCEITMDELKLEIPVIAMNFEKLGEDNIFSWTLVSEPDTKNTIIIR